MRGAMKIRANTPTGATLFSRIISEYSARVRSHLPYLALIIFMRQSYVALIRFIYDKTHAGSLFYLARNCKINRTPAMSKAIRNRISCLI